MRNKLLVLGAFLLSGCIMWDAGYTENRPVSRYNVLVADKLPITYSVSMFSERGDVIAAPDVESLREKIEDGLEATGLFSEIAYGAKGGADSYHIEFVFHQGGMSVEDTRATSLLSGFSLFTIPVCEVLTFDGSAVLSLQGKPIYSSAKAEEARAFVWLPMAPFGLFMNSWTLWHFLEKGTVNALCEDMAQEHKRRFLKEAVVSEIKAD